MIACGTGDSDEEDSNNPRVTRPVCSFVIPMMILNTCTLGTEYGALIDSGYTWCLIPQSVVDELVVCVILLYGGFRKLRLVLGPKPSKDQVEGLGGGTSREDTETNWGGVFLDIYRDLADVFSEEECEVLPPHRSTDCTIELIPGAKLPKPHMYSMTPKELELRWYIYKNLARDLYGPAGPT